MKKLTTIVTGMLLAATLQAQKPEYTIWFDTPNNLEKRAIWFNSRPDLWKGESKPESAGDGAVNPDQGWESQ